jgi:large subunit ribosomal protein L24e
MKCSYCNKEIKFGTGLMYVKKDGKVFYFCSSKCKKNQLLLKRDSKKQTWVRKEIKTK